MPTEARTESPYGIPRGAPAGTVAAGRSDAPPEASGAPEAPARAKIEVRGVGKIYMVKNEEGGPPKEFVVLEDINLDVRGGEFLTLVGPSGCGKSTLLDLLAGLTPLTGGEIRIDGRIIAGPAMDRGLVMQAYALFPWLNVRDNVEFGLVIKKSPKAERRRIGERFLELVGLSDFANRYPHELSGGMKQRVAIARALAFDPEVLLMDEPFAALDAQTREGLQDELLGIWEKTGKTIVFVTHAIDEAVYLADRVAVMATGPGRITNLVDVKLGRPRQGSRASAEFGWIRHKIWQLLQGGEAAGRDGPPPPRPDLAEIIDAQAAL